ncbi:jg8234 [Pararge aegeria aegeria]|uniref:Jg8234 protein n=1 Tax=Pararge aegeria aegeria TaxID=348720 RepID=A0A8S4QMS1_9NEOP|nr:jg8234 [Pararge aegeria aegeria]
MPVEVYSLFNQIPRSFDDDHCFYVNIKKKLIRKTSDVDGLINKKHIEEGLAHLIPTSVYVYHNITVHEYFFNDDDVPDLNIDEVTEPAGQITRKHPYSLCITVKASGALLQRSLISLM